MQPGCTILTMPVSHRILDSTDWWSEDIYQYVTKPGAGAFRSDLLHQCVEVGVLCTVARTMGVAVVMGKCSNRII